MVGSQSPGPGIESEEDSAENSCPSGVSVRVEIPSLKGGLTGSEKATPKTSKKTLVKKKDKAEELKEGKNSEDAKEKRLSLF